LLAKALVALIHQVAQGEVSLAFAGGVGPDREEFGTDAIEIMEAIQAVYSPSGVLVLMDLGSAVLSAELSLELLPDEMKPNIRFCAAPLVEGAIAAAVQASLGSDLDAVCQEAQLSLVPKAEQLDQEIPGTFLPQTDKHLGQSAPGLTVQLKLANEHGLHARPAAKFVQLAASFDADVQVADLTNQKGPVSAKSLNALATLGALHGHQIEITAYGVQAAEAIGALAHLVEDNFGEEVFNEATQMPIPEVGAMVTDRTALLGIPVSEGIAIGPAFHFKPPPPPIPVYEVDQPEEEWLRLEQAREAARKSITNRRTALQASIGEEKAAIFDAHILILDDPELVEQARRRVIEKKHNASMAWKESIAEVASSYRTLENPYLQQRAIDVEDVGNQVLHILAGTDGEQAIVLEEPVILVADDLTPTQTAQLDMKMIKGLITTGGGPTSHSAILARALGIPAIAGADLAISSVPDGTMIALDGINGAVWIDPPDEKLNALDHAREDWLADREQLLGLTHKPAITQDGHPVEIAANAGSLLDAEAAVKNGAEAIGLLRTEFLFLTRTTPPDEDEQVNELKRIGAALGDRPVIVRTLDVGGDKALPYFSLPEEANPFLGVRAIRLSLRNEEIFSAQLRAILRAALDSPFRIMFPMVTTLNEVSAAGKILDEAHRSLDAEGVAHRWPIETGIMVETPAAALLSPVLAQHVDFFSIGTNDLTQYTMAAERGNPALSNMADAFHPAVLKLIAEVVEAAHAHGIWVGVCGELASDPLAVPVLVGLGVDELSMNPGSIPKAKDIVRRIDRAESEALSKEILLVESADRARALAAAYLTDLLTNE
jgi:phosphocarrier protein FPr